MDDLKRIGKALLFPHPAVMLILLPVAAVFLIDSLACLESESPAAILSYALACYTMTIWCARATTLIRYVRNFKNENKYARRWLDDVRLRMNVSLYGTFLWNVAYAVFQLSLGLYHASLWYYALAMYYVCLAVMRFYLSRHTRKHGPGEKMREELIRYRTCGGIFLAMNMALTAMIFFMVYRNQTFHHHEITAIAMAAYTFTTFTFAVINIVKYRKYNSPVFSASKAISLAAACVSILTLESTMLTTFGDDAADLAVRRLLLGASGGVISVFIIGMAIYMIVRASRAMRRIQPGNYGGASI